MLLRNVKVIVQQLFEFFFCENRLALIWQSGKDNWDISERKKNYKRLFYSTSLVEHFICFIRIFKSYLVSIIAENHKNESYVLQNSFRKCAR